MNKQIVANASLATIVGTAAVWFGSHAGGGFATGNQAMNFYVKYGWSAVWIPIISMLILAFCFREGLTLAQHHKTYDYRSFTRKLYEPYDKIFANLFEFAYFCLCFIAIGAAIAGAASLIEQTLGISYGLGVLLTGSVLLALTIFGADLVRNASTVMSICIVVAMLIMLYLGIKAGAPNMSELVGSRLSTEGFGIAAWKALLYAGFQSTLIAVMVSVAQPLNNRSDVSKSVWLGFVFNAVMLTLSCIMLLGFFPESANETLPTFFVCQKLGYSWLQFIYGFVLFLALISTGVTLIFSIVSRFDHVWTNGPGVFQKAVARRITISIIMMICAMGISLLGLTTLVVKGYGMVGYMGIGIIIIPLLTVAPIKNRRNARLESEISQNTQQVA